MTQAPPLPFDVRAISAYTARNGNELSLEVGKVYRVLATDGRGVWWQSKTDEGQVGWFPANYTQVIETVATPPVVEPVPTPQPVIQQQPVHQVQHQPAQSQQPVPAQPQVSAQPQINHSSNGSHAGTVPSDRGQPAKSNMDPAFKTGGPPLKDPCSVTVHLVESTHTSLPSGKSPSFFIYKRAIINNDPKKLKPLFSCSAKAKTGPWKWNEEFKLYIKDAEMEVVCLRFCAKNDFKSKGKDLVGEIEFPLRGAVRKFDKPNGQFQWFPLKNGNEKVGEALLFIEYCDPRPFSGPSDVQHKGHVGLTSAGGFEIRDIPQEWKQLFRVLNIKKKDLENNAQMAQEVFDIMQKAVSEGIMPGSDQYPAQENNNETYEQPQEEVNHYSPAVSSPVTPMVSTPSNPYQPPVQQQQHSVSTPAPPPPPSQTNATGPRPPPPPSQSNNTGPKPPPPPGPATSTPKSGGGMSLLEQIRGGTTLKPAQVKQVQAGTASTGNPLADTLLNAMTKYRVDIEGKDEEAADDWD